MCVRTFDDVTIAHGEVERVTPVELMSVGFQRAHVPHCDGVSFPHLLLPFTLLQLRHAQPLVLRHLHLRIAHNLERLARLPPLIKYAKKRRVPLR